MSDPGSSHQRVPEELNQPSGSDSVSTSLGYISPPDGGDEKTVISTGLPPLFPQIGPGAHPSELGKLLEGEYLGHFRLEEFIGGGGMGAVFRAHDTMLDRTVAVKVLSFDQSRDGETQRRFKNEAQSAARLDHENIARVHYVGEDRGVHYIVFEHIDGINIRDLVDQQGPLSLADAISITLQVADALAHASLRDVVHRDIKPSNVLLTAGGRAKLVDMGLARLHQVEHTDNDLTASGVTLGTFDYISPEQARDPRTADVRSDLYSLGCTFYFMLTGRPPFPEGTVLQKLLQHQGDEPPDVRQFRPELPIEAANIISKLLSKSPETRYQEPQELCHDLFQLADQLGISPLADVKVAVSRQPTGAPATWKWGPDSFLGRHLPWMVPAGLLVAIVLGLEFVWSFSDDRVVLHPPEAPSPLIEMPVEEQERPTAVSRDGAAAASPEEDQDSSSRPGVAAGGTEGEDASPTTSPADDSDGEANPVVPTAELVDFNPLAEELAKENPESGLGQDPLSGGILAVDSSALGAVAAPSPAGAESGLSVDDSATQTTAGERPGSVSSGGAVESTALIVDPAGGTGAFETLQAACLAAKSGDVIELRYDGPAAIGNPIILPNLKLTVRAGKGFQPQVMFRPGPGDTNPDLFPRSMITVTGGELSLFGVHLKMDVGTAVPSEHWSLIESRGAELISLTQCVLTVENTIDGRTALHPNVSVVNVQPAPGDGDVMPRVATTVRKHPVTVNLQQCILRGETGFLRMGPSEEVQLSWQDGLLAISERMFSFGQSLMVGRQQGRLQADLQFLTVFCRQGLLRYPRPEAAMRLPRVTIKCKDSIVMADAEARLIEQPGGAQEMAFRESFVWNGERNFYEGFQTFWKIGDVALDRNVKQLDLNAWQSYWESSSSGGDEISPQQGVVVWKQLPARNRPLHAHTATDYRLADGETANPARGAAGDGGDVGMRRLLLPALEEAVPGPQDDSASESPSEADD